MVSTWYLGIEQRFFKIYLCVLYKLRLLPKVLKRLNKTITKNALLHSKLHYLSSAIYLYLSFCYAKLGQSELADIKLSKAKFQDHGNDGSDVYIQKLMLGDNKIFDKALELIASGHYQKAIEKIIKKPSSIHKDIILGAASYYKNDIKTALAYLLNAEAYLSKKHNSYHIYSSSLHFRRSYIYYLLKDYDLCVTDLCKSIDLYDKNIESLLLRAKIYKQRENMISSIMDYESILRISPKNPSALNGLKQINNFIPNS